QAQGNFVWINDDDRIPPLIASCAQEGISLRYFLGDGVRITLGQAAINSELLAIAEQIASRS
ncbi:MAG: aminotransferase, partial [Angustibacter sp.]